MPRGRSMDLAPFVIYRGLCRRIMRLVGGTVSGSREEARMELSYSQNLEDYHLSVVFAGQATGTYIDIGAGASGS